MKKYWLGEAYPEVYLTRRESECMMYVLKGNTISTMSTKLKLSPRTVEFYIKQIKSKLKCRTRTELREKILQSGFINGIDFAVK